MTDPAALAELHRTPTHRTLRLPPDTSVQLTPRQLAVIDHPAFQRLRSVRAVGPAHLVYPGATHTRFEHSIGVYHKALTYLQRLLPLPEFRDVVTAEDLLTLLAAALLHDLGHYPMAHSLEALHHKGNDAPRHEDLAASIIRGELATDSTAGPRTLATILIDEWGVDAERVVRLIQLSPRAMTHDKDALLATIISSGIDADKMDYLTRDSIHMGVSFGLHFDQPRLLDSLAVAPDGRSIALTAKGRAPAEMFAFCRYTMFSEVYWHHAARAAAAMLEAALSDLQARGLLSSRREALLPDLLSRSDDQLHHWLLGLAPPDTPAHRLLDGLHAHHRRLYKRILELNRTLGTDRHREAWARLLALNAAEIRDTTEHLRHALRHALGVPLEPGDLIVDIPPRDKDRWEDVTILPSRSWQGGPWSLSEISAVVRGIAGDFIAVVKRIRIFVAPHLVEPLRNDQRRVEALLLDAILS